jgi:hypothetical protein
VSRATALQPLHERLLARGFTRRRGQFLRGADGWQDWVGLNTASHKTPVGVVLVHPVAGVRVDAVEEKMWELVPADTPDYRSTVPTVTEPLRYLPTLASMPDHEWYMSEDLDASADVADEIVARLDTAGEDYFAAMRDPDTVLAALARLAVNGLPYSLRWAAAALVLGRHEQAVAATEAGLAELERTSEWAAAAYRPAMERLAVEVGLRA